jgi:hypothetical protein
MADDKRQEVVNVLTRQGVEQESDLQYVSSSDLENILPPIQVRKMVSFLTSKYGAQNTQPSPAPVPAPSPVPATVLRASPILNSPQICAENWVSGFVIPWEKCSSRLMMALEQGKPVQSSDLRELVTHVMSDVSRYTRKAPRSVLRKIAAKIVKRSPSAFADVINGKVVNDGVESIMLMLEAKKENMERILKRDAGDSGAEGNANRPRKRRLVMCVDSDINDMQPSVSQACKSSLGYGCGNWQPAVHSTGDAASEKLFLSQQSSVMKSQRDASEIQRLMNATYDLQREKINENVPVVEVLNHWPLLGEEEYLVKHFETLTEVRMSALQNSIEQKYEKLVAFCQFHKANNKSLSVTLEEAVSAAESTKSCRPLVETYVLLMTNIFRDTEANLVSFIEVRTNNKCQASVHWHIHNIGVFF